MTYPTLQDLLRPAPALFAAVALLAGSAYATDRNVPAPYTTIQAAINASSNGDNVIIAPGTYNENININGKNIVIKAFNTNFDTIIDGQQAGPVVTFNGSESPNCSIRNIVIRNGKSATGAGIKGNSTQATLKNCTIGANVATGNGGGIYEFSGLIQNCTITLNQAGNGGGLSDCDGTIDSCKITNNKSLGAGGGIFNSPALIQFCEIRNNEAANRGGGISASHGIIRANLIAANKAVAAGPIASPNGFGGGINDAGGTVTLNTIAGNSSGGDGGGLANITGIVQNNVIVENSARRGGGIAASAGRIENNTIWDNAASSIGGGAHNLGTQVANCIIYQNTAPADAQWSGPNVPVFSCVQNWAGAQPDIITAYPMFNDPTKNKFDLLPGSPCIDAGKLIPGLAIDFQGDSRPYNGTNTPAGDGSDYDIGADEFVPDNIELSGALTGVVTKSKGVVPKLKYSIKGTVPVANTGSDATTAIALVQFVLSTDNILDPGDTLVGKTVQLKNLKGGKVKKVKVSINLPINQTATGMYLFALIDSTNTVAEGDENNNISMVGPLP